MSYYSNENDQEKAAHKHLEKAYNFQMQGDLNSAISEYKLSIQINPSAEAWTFLGWTYSFSEDYDEAIECCKKAIEIDSEYGNAYNDIGAYLIKLGRLDEAIIWLEQAIQAERYNTPHYPHYNLGRIFERRGLWFEALAEYKTALKIEKNYEPAKDASIRLQALLN